MRGLFARVPRRWSACGRSGMLSKTAVISKPITAARAVTAAAGSSADNNSHFFAGAKEMHVLDGYEKNPGIPRFDLAVDFGWFYFITKPFFYLLSWIGHTVGNFGVAIILFTLLVRGAMFPVAAQSYRSMQKMKTASPKLKELQAKHKNDPTKLQGEMMAFYRTEKLNPMAGCLPMLIQIPVFLSLYKVLSVTLEMRHAHFLGFLKDLSIADPTNVFNLFGLLPFNPPAAMHLGLLPILMGITSFLQMRMTPTPTTDATQQQMFKIIAVDDDGFAGGIAGRAIALLDFIQHFRNCAAMVDTEIDREGLARFFNANAAQFMLRRCLA